MSTTCTQTVLVPHPSHDPVLEGHLPITIPSPPDLTSSSASEKSSLAPKPSPLKRFSVVFMICGITFCGSVANGLVTVGLPHIAKDLHLPPSLSFWPASVSSLTTASTLLLAGSVADVLGPRWVDLVGCFGIAAFMTGAGFCQTGTELVVMRAMQGIALSLHLASSISIITSVLPQGRSRNLTFSFLGVSQPLGFSLGLVVGGLLADSVGWRAGWYMNGGFALALSALGVWALPSGHEDRGVKEIVHDLKTKVDWVGALLASGFMAMLCYLLAVISTDVNRIKEPVSIVLLCLVSIALPGFVTWVHHQVKKGRPALIPNKLWRNPTFTTVCVIIALSFSVINALELFASLFFQEVQHLSAIQASLRILPSLVVGALLQLCLGFFVHRIPAVWIVTLTSILCAGSPLLMAVIQPSWPYWANAFVAQLLQPISCDALFTVGLIVITDVFPEDTQALAGAVFNTAAQFGMALGLAITQVVSTQVTKEHSGKDETYALMEGYRASFWTMFGMMILCAVVGGFGLRKAGRVGLKRD